MKILHIFKEKPSNEVLQLVDLQSQCGEVSVIPLYEGSMDYDTLVQKIEASDKVVSWGNVASKSDVVNSP